MVGFVAVSIAESAVIADLAAFDLGRGAIAGALIAGAAFLAGYAAVRRGGLAICAALMVALAAVLEFSWLGLFPWLSANGGSFLLAIFAAAGLVFLSASVGAAKHNPLLGGVMFTTALILAGLGALNFIDRVEVAGLIRWSALAVGGFGVLLALSQAFRGDAGARLILPGVTLAIAATLIGPLGAVTGASGLVSHAVFTLGVLAAGLVAVTEPRSALDRGARLSGVRQAFTAPGHDARLTFSSSAHAGSRERNEIIINSQLGRVLDYAGVGIWDWSPDKIDQTDSLHAILGADSNAPFTPDALRQFIHKDDLKLLETEVLAAEDGPFDVSLKLFNGRMVRVRGARAAAEQEGVLERIVAFFEIAGAKFAGAAHKSSLSTRENNAPVDDLGGEIDIANVVAAFQPIVSLSDMKTVGYEALARLNGKDGDTAQLLRAAAHAGKSGAFAQTMLHQAAAFLAEGRKDKKKNASLFVAMNVSWTQMRDPAFVEAVGAVTKQYGLPKGALVLELTEGEAIGHEETATPVFRKLKGLGAALAFDDFGAGFSCLSNLRKYDFDYIKIDKSFAEDLEDKGDGAKIVGALAGMGRDLGLKVIIEGLESDAAAKTAASLGCAYGQGYALGRPAAVQASDRAKDTSSGDKKRAIARPVVTETEDGAPEDALELTPDHAAAPQGEAAPARPMRWRSLSRLRSR